MAKPRHRCSGRMREQFTGRGSDSLRSRRTGTTPGSTHTPARDRRSVSAPSSGYAAEGGSRNLERAGRLERQRSRLSWRLDSLSQSTPGFVVDRCPRSSKGRLELPAMVGAEDQVVTAGQHSAD